MSLAKLHVLVTAGAVAVLLAVGSAVFCQPPQDQPSEAVPAEGAFVPPPVAEADHATLENVLRQNGISTTPRQPGPARWAQDLSTALGAALARFVGRALPGLGSRLESLGRIAAWGLLALVALLTGLVAARILEARRPRKATAKATTDPLPSSAATELDWRAVLEARLAAGAGRLALEALWHWLAARLVASGRLEAPEPSWTSRELIRRARRDDLLAPIRRFDYLLYGTASPAAAEVRHLWHELEEAI